ncbi:MAG: 16S rRNA (guanine(527)-N(7))-methyltransferase RsmG [Thermodesulfobacteriota bacterium]|nr:16S rRNA (guanine(527)-N(7))-methyltransferase RsmG [Thermodesulfobacteriota bacterium]
MSDRFTEGLSRLGLELSEKTVESEMSFLNELLRWNQRVNLTSIRNRDEAIEMHLLDSLLLLLHLESSMRVLDMGSGGGLPGIPLAIAIPSLQVVSVDSIGKKINFQKHIKRKLQLPNLTVVQTRIEDLEQSDLGQEKYDLIVSRAFASLGDFLCHAAPRLRSGGRLLAMKGAEGRAELRATRETIEHIGYSDPEIYDYELPFSHAERQLIFLKKSSISQI